MKKNITVLINKDKDAVVKFKKATTDKFPGAKIIVYGSKARGEASKFSDIDLLVLLDQEIDTATEDAIFKMAFEIGLEFDVVLSVVVESKDFFKSKLANVMPFFDNIRREGIAV